VNLLLGTFVDVVASNTSHGAFAVSAILRGLIGFASPDSQSLAPRLSRHFSYRQFESCGDVFAPKSSNRTAKHSALA
jgi:hypothetical protein